MLVKALIFFSLFNQTDFLKQSKLKIYRIVKLNHHLLFVFKTVGSFVNFSFLSSVTSWATLTSLIDILL